MLEIITKFGAVIHIDEHDPRQATMLAVADAAFGGIDFQMIVDQITAAPTESDQS